MKSTILIKTHSTSAYRAIRSALVAAHIGNISVSGLTISATINPKDFDCLLDVVDDAADNANVSREDYEIKTMHKVSNPLKH